ncbi:MAG: DUF3870 domain-containing protein [Thermaerobacter sp.]|nr:DUF3870 domain-containing protein [Thermaerobacter sp.]
MHGVLFIGHAKLPLGSAARNVSEILALSCVADPQYGVILDVSDTLVTDSAHSIIKDILIGQSLLDGLDSAIVELHERYHGAALPAVEAALKDTQAQWQRWHDSAQRNRTNDISAKKDYGPR